MATNVLRPKGPGCSLRARSLTSWATGQVVGHADSTTLSLIFFDSTPSQTVSNAVYFRFAI